jgi:methionyl-tRNA formyltransferase
VLLLFIDDKIDTGAMILSSETPIEETENGTTARPIDGSGKKLSLLP